MEKISVMIADSYKLNRDTWAYMLNTDSRFEVIAECADTCEALPLSAEKHPDVILMNINIPFSKGMEEIREIRKKLPTSHVIGISANSLPSCAKKTIQMGAKGYITKNSSKEEMILAILEVASGKKYICEEIKNIFSTQLLHEENMEPVTDAISKRELEIIELLKRGLSSKEIAEELFISLRTVEVHRHNILKKLKVKNTVSLINFINSSAIYS